MTDDLVIALKAERRDGGVYLMIFLSFICLISLGLKWISLLLISIFCIIGIGLFRLKKIIRLRSKELFIETYFHGIKWSSKYRIDKIESLNYRENVKSNMYISKSRIRVLGKDITPESEKRYYYYPEVLSFYYEGKRIEIGKGYEKFGGVKIYERIKDIKTAMDGAVDLEDADFTNL